MAVGVENFASHVYSKLDDQDLDARGLAQKILSLTRDIAKNHKGDDDANTTFLVCGKDKDGLEMYAVEIVNTESSRRGISRVENPMYNMGSGTAYVVPAIKRDNEKGIWEVPTNPLEAILLCFNIGAKADNDTGANGRLQLGFVSRSNSRTLMPSSLQFATIEEYKKTLTNLTGISLAGKKISRRFAIVQRTVDAFYRALETQIHCVLTHDAACNTEHTRLKDGRTKLSTYLRRLRDRRAEVDDAWPLVRTFMEGGIKNLIFALKKFNRKEESIFREAEKLAR